MEALRTKPSPARPVPDSGLRARILMVDDHQANLLALEAILAPLGEELVGVTSGEDALRELLDGEFALILMDVQMPGMDGIETAALIKQREKNRSTPIIFLTAIAKDPSYIFRGYSQGAVDYLLKPFDPEILRTKVSVFVDLWRRGELIKRQAAMLRAQELLELERRSEVRFHALTDSMPQCVWAAHRDGEIHYCNRVWREYAGAVAGTSFFAAVPEDELLAVRDAWTATIRSGHPMEREQRLRRHDGELRWHLFRVVPERASDGAVTGWIATATDIDHQKRVEEAHAALLLREQESRAQLEAANRAKDEFLATVSHELRTPLNAILGWTRMLRSGAVPTGQQLERALETIERNARAQTQLIEDILDVSRIIAGKLRVQVRAIDLRSVIEAAVEAVRPAADAKQLDLSVQLAEDASGFQGDPDRLQQVVWNLLSNAIKFTPAQGKVTVELRRAGGHVEIIVADSGIGIAPDFLPHVFDRFRQADSSTTRTQGGLGLGLAIVRHLVEVHGGTVRAESAGEGKGARFTVQLPLRQVQPRRAEATDGASGPRREELAPAEPMSLSGVRVLVVDDDEDARELIDAMLSTYGAHVDAVASADGAVARIREDPPDVLVSDIGLPSEDGYSLIRRVRELDGGRRVLALALTAYAGMADHRRCLEAGFDEHVSKPIEPAELAGTIGAMLSSARARAANGSHPQPESSPPLSLVVSNA
ncbi:MAG TPA: response regulator [Myxococcales bacterium]|nr:response regulator [Myxococcales bacterium]